MNKFKKKKAKITGQNSSKENSFTEENFEDFELDNNLESQQQNIIDNLNSNCEEYVILTLTVANVYHQTKSRTTYATYVIYSTTNAHVHLRQKQLIKMMKSNNQMIRKNEMLNWEKIFKTF